MNDDFNYFVDSLILAAANRQVGPKMEWQNFAELCAAVDTNSPQTWISMARERIQSQGFGRFTPDSNNLGQIGFKINAGGISHASTVRIARRRPTAIERFKALPFGKGAWDVLKILVGFALGYFFKGSSA